MIGSTNIAADIKPYVSFTAKFAETTMDIELVPPEIAQNRLILPSIPTIKRSTNRLLILIRFKLIFTTNFSHSVVEETFKVFKGAKRFKLN